MTKKSKTLSPAKKTKRIKSSPKPLPKIDAGDHVIISKTALKSLQDGMTRLEMALAEIANALRVLE